MDSVNTLMPKQKGRQFSNAFSWMKIYKFRLRFHWCLFPIDNIPALVQIMAWRRPGDKPLSEPKMVSLLTHICVTWPRWVKAYLCINPENNYNISILRPSDSLSCPWCNYNFSHLVCKNNLSSPGCNHNWSMLESDDNVSILECNYNVSILVCFDNLSSPGCNLSYTWCVK